MHYSRAQRKQYTKEFNKQTRFISKLDIIDTYVKLQLELPTDLTPKQIALFKDYIQTRRSTDQKFDELITKLDQEIINGVKSTIDNLNE